MLVIWTRQESGQKNLCDNVSYCKIIGDVTYDGYKDIALKSGSNGETVFYNIYQYDSKNDRYYMDPLLSDIANPLFDSELQTITSFIKDGQFANVFVAYTYHFNQGKYELIEEVQQQLVDTNNPQKGYVYIQKKPKDGVLIEIARENFE